MILVVVFGSIFFAIGFLTCALLSAGARIDHAPDWINDAADRL